MSPPQTIPSNPEQYVNDTHYLEWVPVVARPMSPNTITVTL